MADHTAENNNDADPDTEVNNSGPTGLNADNNNRHAGDMLGPSEYKDGLTASSSSLSRRLEYDRRPLQQH